MIGFVLCLCLLHSLTLSHLSTHVLILHDSYLEEDLVKAQDDFRDLVVSLIRHLAKRDRKDGMYLFLLIP